MSDSYNGWSFRVSTPDGTMTVFVMEDSENNPIGVDVFIGKAGSAIAAWSAACSAMISLALKTTPLQEIINGLADITSDGTARIGASTTCRSGPEGIYSALIQYRNTQRDERVNRESTRKEVEGMEFREGA